MLESIQKSTLSSYSPAIKRWWKFGQSHIFSPSKNQVLQFFMREFQASLAYSTINCTRSAISLLTGPAALNDPTSTRFFKGIANLRPSAPKYNVTWDPQQVLRYLRIQPNTSALPLEAVTKKLVTLLAIATGQRLQTLKLIQINNLQESDSEIRIFIADRVKTSGDGRPQPLMVIPFFPEPQICPALTLKHDLKVTQPLRGTISQLFISTCPPTRPVSTQTLGRWIKDVLHKSGVDPSFKPHSTRHASTSAAYRGGMKVDAILRAVGWSPSQSIFARFYNRPIHNNPRDYTNTVFNV